MSLVIRNRLTKKSGRNFSELNECSGEGGSGKQNNDCLYQPCYPVNR